MSTPPVRASFVLRVSTLALLGFIAGCSAAPQAAPHAAPLHGLHGDAPAMAHVSGVDAELAEVARVHGAAGPWAVAGYRMGKYALRKLGLDRQSFDLEITHKSPRAVQFSCIADGASAATGASLGKLNLAFEEAAEIDVRTVYRNRATGASVTLRPTAAFKARYRDLPDEQILRAGREVMELSEDRIFEEVSPTP